jgi:DNA-binding LytR/AlgR family response regulator
MNRPAALIAEDEPLLAAHLRSELQRLWPELDVLASVADGDSALREALSRRPDLLFLDIRMPGRDGLEVATAVAEDWPAGSPPPLVVFVTAYEEHAVAAFERAAIDYLQKPVQPARLAQTVARLQAALAARAAALDGAAAVEAAIAPLRRLLGALPVAARPGAPAADAPPAPRLEVLQAGVGATIHLVPVAEVLYFEAADKYVRVVTAEREHLVRTPLRELQAQLDPARFWQIHRGTVVRADAIATATRDDSGKVHLTLRGHADRLVASRLYAHLFRAM